MYCRVFACDFDGTGAADGRLAPEVAAALAAARAQGYVTLLVTGRVLEDLHVAEVDFAVFDAVVAENGAVVWWPASGREKTLGTPPSERFLADLRARNVAFVAGAVVVGTWDRHVAEVVDTIRRHGMASQIAFNRAAMMVLPSGVDKALGVRHALAELRRSEHNMVAFGDAENDRPLFEAAEVGVAARGAIAGLAAIADETLGLPGSAGVAHYVEQVVARGGEIATPGRHAVEIGTTTDGAPSRLPCSGENVLVSGDPRCGKSGLAGLVAEHLLARGYRLCVLDPEGDHTGLGRAGSVLVLGTDVPLPQPEVLPKLVAQLGISLVASLAGLSLPRKLDYVAAALEGLDKHRARTGLPHWTFVDEAQYFFDEGSRNLSYLEQPHGSVLLATYRPSLLAERVTGRIGVHLAMGTEIEEERYFLTGTLQRQGPADLHPAEALATLGGSRVGLLEPGRWSTFVPGPRDTPHAHHARKYADTLLPWERSFHFMNADDAGRPVARSVGEFRERVGEVPMASIRHHLLLGDFSRWALTTLGDASLAAGFAKIEHAAQAGAAPTREEILRHVEDRYLV